jgi:uncharacterized protein
MSSPRRSVAQRAFGALGGFVVLALLGSSGCAGYSAQTKDARTALDKGNAKVALEVYNAALEVESAKDLPSDVTGDNALLLLERSSVLQQLGTHDLSSRDLEVADKQVEMLDFSRGTLDEIGRFIFSDDTGPYKAPPYEKLMINTMNMVNYLVRGNLNGARIEARRFAVMQKYLDGNEEAGAAMLGAGSYLAGFIFEKSNDPQSAMLYYDEALRHGEFPTLNEAIVRLSKRAAFRSPRIEKVLSSASAQEPVDEDSAEVLVVVSYGRVPAKVALRLPIGLALVAAGDSMPADKAAEANRLAAQGLVTWVNFPSMPKPSVRYTAPVVKLQSALLPNDSMQIDELAVDAWKSGRGLVIASAITRTVSRVIAGKAIEKASGDSALGLVLSLGTQATLTAVDTPDTRSWTTLPARMSLTRVRVPAGKHSLTIQARGDQVVRNAEVKAGGWAAVNFTNLR